MDLTLGPRLRDEVIAPLHSEFVEKDEVLDLLGVALLARENVFLLGPPGTAKSALVRRLAERLDGTTFEYLLTRFTEPNELFGPFDLRRLREGDLVTNTEGMLPQADVVFLDELLNANSAILNSLLSVLNERVLVRGRERFELPTLMVVGASNRLPEDEALAALFDRFLLRAQCGPVPSGAIERLLETGWTHERSDAGPSPTLTCSDLRQAQASIAQVEVSTIRPIFAESVLRLRHAGLDLSDRRAVKLQRAVAASAFWCGRASADPTDLWVLRHIWESETQIPVVESLVDTIVAEHSATSRSPLPNEEAHPQSRSALPPNPTALVEALVDLEQAIQSQTATPLARAQWHEQVALLSTRVEWIEDDAQRDGLRQRVRHIWDRLVHARDRE